MTRSIVIALLSALLVPLIWGWLSAGQKSSRIQGTFKRCEFGAGYQALMLVCLVFFASLAGLAWKFPGRTDPGTLPWAIATFVVFAGLSLFALLLGRRSFVLWNDEEVEGADLLGRRHRLSWRAVTRAEYVPWASALRLQAEDGRTIWVSPSMRGFSEFVADLEHLGPTA